MTTIRITEAGLDVTGRSTRFTPKTKGGEQLERTLAQRINIFGSANGQDAQLITLKLIRKITGEIKGLKDPVKKAQLTTTLSEFLTQIEQNEKIKSPAVKASAKNILSSLAE